ncbi:hypothetical protein HY572_00330 [Candidatus Micrarchaeota archaeon]|nr:hypothetical protein [Candidatus Micrarchaeota archaeon]
MAEKPWFARVRVRLGDVDSIQKGHFTVFDLLDASFSFSAQRKQLAAQVLGLVRERPRTFSELLVETGSQKSALYLAVTALLQSGFLEQKKRGRPYALSPAFSGVLEGYAAFWRAWTAKDNV